MTEIPEDIMQDAKRYRWLRAGNAYAPEEWMLHGGSKLDEYVDSSIAEFEAEGWAFHLTDECPFPDPENWLVRMSDGRSIDASVIWSWHRKSSDAVVAYRRKPLDKP